MCNFYGGMGACPHDNILTKRSSVAKEKGAVSYGIRQKFAPRRSVVLGVWGAHSPPFFWLYFFVVLL